MLQERLNESYLSFKEPLENFYEPEYVLMMPEGVLINPNEV